MNQNSIDRISKCVDNVEDILKGGPGSGRKGHRTERKGKPTAPKYSPRKDPSSKRERPGKVTADEEKMQDLMYRIQEEGHKPSHKEKRFIESMRGN